ncbi:MAG: tetratricopeptide repeat protein [Planctomycetaceae bacterium]|nr:tetratricopeptide repeat protein [Planctomycetaceae bacterium]
MKSQDQAEKSGAGPRWLRAFFIVFVLFWILVIVGDLLFVWLIHEDPQKLLKTANLAFSRRDYALTDELTRRILKQDPQNHAAALLAGRTSEAMGRFEAALEFFEQVPDDKQIGPTARIQAGELLTNKLQHLSAAVSEFRRAVNLDPENPLANERLAYLLGLAGSNREATPLRLRLIRLDQFGPIHLLLLCMGDYIFENPEQIEAFRAAAPDDPLVLTALARERLDKQDPVQAEKLLRPVVRNHPEMLESQVKLGQALLEQHQAAEFLKWHAELPVDIENLPGLWFLRANWAREQSDKSAAVRCYLEVLDRDPNHQAANYQLAQLLVSIGKEKLAAPFLERSGKLQKFDTAVRAAWSGGGAEDAMRQSAQEAESLGLIWEAFGWHSLAHRKYPQVAWARDGSLRLRPQIAGLPLTRTRPGLNLAAAIDRSDFPLPNWSNSRTVNQAESGKKSSFGPVSFTNQATEAGLTFQYFNSSNPLRPERKMQEFTGGGVAALDFDSDGWSDVYLTQGSRWPPRFDEFEHLDRLFQNQGNGKFRDITLFANLKENGFSQGVTVGDFDNDGFPDLYVGNIGSNRFYKNNGDGTFDDITLQTGTGGDSWTTSSLIADLNNDGLPDLYVVNYLAGSDVLERVCADETGHPRSCMPRIYPAAQDRLYVNLGDGQFRDVTQASGIMLADGKGMGIVAADFDGSRKLNLFVANDAVPNFYFVNQTPPGGEIPIFAEQGISSGLALNEDGRAQACMGVATGNLDNDQRLALFVTNFHSEPNTLYHQQAGSVFFDETRKWGLFESSIPMVGFGTQFVDAELDGFLDLILTNGDVDDSRDLGRMYQMPPQYFRNAGNGRFSELSASSLGPFFQGKYLGRGLARLDWNRDGCDDMIISHLDAPAALLTNTTQSAGHFIAVQLRAVTTSRDAIGTTVTVDVAGRKLVRQLVAGDGYHASNERQLVIGLGDAIRIDELTVAWPSGLKQAFRDISVDSQVLIVEHRPLVTRLKATKER